MASTKHAARAPREGKRLERLLAWYTAKQRRRALGVLWTTRGEAIPILAAEPQTLPVSA